MSQHVYGSSSDAGRFRGDVLNWLCKPLNQSHSHFYTREDPHTAAAEPLPVLTDSWMPSFQLRASLLLKKLMGHKTNKQTNMTKSLSSLLLCTRVCSHHFNMRINYVVRFLNESFTSGKQAVRCDSSCFHTFSHIDFLWGSWLISSSLWAGRYWSPERSETSRAERRVQFVQIKTG